METRTPERLLYDLDHCTGPCGELCLSCPESHELQEIRQVIADLIEENEKYKAILGTIQDENFLREMSAKHGIKF